MGLELQIFAERKCDQEWKLISRRDLDELDHQDGSDTHELWWSTDKVLMAVLGANRKSYCSKTDFESVEMTHGLPTDCTQELKQELTTEFSSDCQIRWAALGPLSQFPYRQKYMERVAYVEKGIAHFFFTKSTVATALPKWPIGIPKAYSSGSAHGILVHWIESYEESIDPEFFKVLRALELIATNCLVRMIAVID